ncbi:MAG: CDP-alcohol phosphatidyltransferase family protein [Candidatus Marsarchaeota archaeon]|nr:CDP-alcohol phosphatidyltransferase family protein [Candidatus Marsarchaeota archaeon]MCL5094374.1 CDP-alcohol phosphatidyltransferase family protein [Candidatus Marsarchaeota archaeon]
MKYADLITLFRTALIFVVVYFVLIKFNVLLTLFIILLMFGLDGIDGIVARHENKTGKKPSKYGARLDVAGDRIIEFVFWILFVFIHLIPLFILLLIVLRHSFADAFMAAKGTSSKMKTKFARIVYSSNIGRGGVNVVKIITFSYLSWLYITQSFLIKNYMLIGYILTGILVSYVLLRGIAEIYESAR